MAAYQRTVYNCIAWYLNTPTRESNAIPPEHRLTEIPDWIFGSGLTINVNCVQFERPGSASAAPQYFISKHAVIETRPRTCVTASVLEIIGTTRPLAT
ncbi:hypothetical protein PHMEG_0003417 [Phytophthora megakarya]|uniref:Uncharacterized protein n=1 Tax=Phytophthora megakarya TaxID=4795 RepID=A0A225WWQ7_9STRA|nr:hypothetical protein PHMEG_0003417 [Phytophthora megakarya]